LDLLPPLISYSPLSIPLSSSRKLTLPRRDLFDARFQLISEGRGDTDDGKEDKNTLKDKQLDSSSALEFLDSPSDLVPGVYEGGLKTWECSLDLVDYLDCMKDGSGYEGIQGKRILEVELYNYFGLHKDTHWLCRSAVEPRSHLFISCAKYSRLPYCPMAIRPRKLMYTSKITTSPCWNSSHYPIFFSLGVRPPPLGALFQ